MNDCTCAKKSFLHLAGCPASQLSSKLALDHLHKAAFALPNSVLFYIAEDITQAADKWRHELLKNSWMCVVENHEILTVILSNGSEVTFLPENEAYCLLDLPSSNHVFIEGSMRSKDISEALEKKTNKVTLVDPVTKEVL